MEETIIFHAEDVTLPDFFDEPRLVKWLNELAASLEVTIVQLNYIFCSDEYLLTINQDYHQHDYYTDIITFPYQQGKKLESDIFISLDRVQENATDFADGDYARELLRVMAHGLLHLTGLGDKTESEAEKMREAENKAIESYAFVQA